MGVALQTCCIADHWQIPSLICCHKSPNAGAESPTNDSQQIARVCSSDIRTENNPRRINPGFDPFIQDLLDLSQRPLEMICQWSNMQSKFGLNVGYRTFMQLVTGRMK